MKAGRATVDVRKAFSKSISYEELAAATVEPLRLVNSELDSDTVEILRRFLGFEDFNPATEVLSNSRLGTGNVDAPRCFGMELDQAFAKIGAAGLRTRPPLRRRRTSLNVPGSIDFVGTDHFDDIKRGCDWTEQHSVSALRTSLVRVSWKLPRTVLPIAASSMF